MTERICNNCIHFHQEFNAIHIIQALILDSLGKNTNYGKCRAIFLDNNGEIREYNKGVFSIEPCDSTDDRGNELFEEVPVG